MHARGMVGLGEAEVILRWADLLPEKSGMREVKTGWCEGQTSIVALLQVI